MRAGRSCRRLAAVNVLGIGDSSSVCSETKETHKGNMEELRKGGRRGWVPRPRKTWQVANLETYLRMSLPVNELSPTSLAQHVSYLHRTS